MKQQPATYPIGEGPAEIRHCGELLALVVPARFRPGGIRFLTEPNNSLQLAVMAHPDGHDIRAHTHHVARREVNYTQEALFIRRGRVHIDIYGEDGAEVASFELSSGDVILLLKGGHGFKALGDLEMIEIKQGPYLGADDKAHF